MSPPKRVANFPALPCEPLLLVGPGARQSSAAGQRERLRTVHESLNGPLDIVAAHRTNLGRCDACGRHITTGAPACDTITVRSRRIHRFERHSSLWVREDTFHVDMRISINVCCSSMVALRSAARQTAGREAVDAR